MGLLINAEGQLETSAWAVEQIGLLLATIDDPVAVLTEAAEKSQDAWLAARLGTPQARNDVWSAMYAEEPRLAQAAAGQWKRIRERIVPPPF